MSSTERDRSETAEPTEAPLPRRRVSRFVWRLSLLLLGLAVGMCVYIEQAGPQARAVAAIEQSGGEVTYAYNSTVLSGPFMGGTMVEQGFRGHPAPVTFDVESDELTFASVKHTVQQFLIEKDCRDLWDRVFAVEFQGCDINHDLFRQMQTLDDLKFLSFHNVTFDVVAAREYFGTAPNLEWLYLEGTNVDDAFMEAIAGLPQLKHLVVYDCGISDTGAAALRKCRTLEHLELSAMPLTDAVAGAFETLPALIDLRLNYTAVGDPSLEVFARMTRLQRLELTGTSVSFEGLRKLASHPGLQYVEVYDTQVTSDEIGEFHKLRITPIVARGGPVVP